MHPAISWLVCNSKFSGNSTAFLVSHLLDTNQHAGCLPSPILHNGPRSYTSHQQQSFCWNHRILELCLIETCLTVSMVWRNDIIVGTKPYPPLSIKLSLLQPWRYLLSKIVFSTTVKPFFFKRRLASSFWTTGFGSLWVISIVSAFGSTFFIKLIWVEMASDDWSLVPSYIARVFSWLNQLARQDRLPLKNNPVSFVLY